MNVISISLSIASTDGPCPDAAIRDQLSGQSPWDSRSKPN
jgi:hypothetical protein